VEVSKVEKCDFWLVFGWLSGSCRGARTTHFAWNTSIGVARMSALSDDEIGHCLRHSEAGFSYLIPIEMVQDHAKPNNARRGVISRRVAIRLVLGLGDAKTAEMYGDIYIRAPPIVK
jgi:hypothetical protein